MNRPTTLQESHAAWEADRPITAATPAARVQDRRTFYAGAQEALLLVQQGRTVDALLGEVRQFAATIGRAEERADG